MKTFKNLQDEVLDWMADGDDVGDLRALVASGINRAHTRLLTQTQWDFMLWPRTETISVTSGEKYYSLHPLFFSPLFFYNPTTDEYLEELSVKSLMEAEEDWQDGTIAEPDRHRPARHSRRRRRHRDRRQRILVELHRGARHRLRH
jgi:hypothetical protein